MQANSKTQTVVAASNLWKITLAAAPDYESGMIEIAVNALGTSGETYVLHENILYCITNGTTGVATVFVLSSGVVGSASGTFAITAAVSASVVGTAVTFLVTTANTAGAQSSATITGTITCWNGHAVTIL